MGANCKVVYHGLSLPIQQLQIPGVVGQITEMPTSLLRIALYQWPFLNWYLPDNKVYVGAIFREYTRET